MSEPQPAPQDPQPLDLADQVDLICDQFEAALRQGQPVSIEEFLAKMTASGRPELLRQLVALEIDVRRARGETISFLTYYRRFPEATKILDELQSEWNLRDSSGFIAVRSPVQLSGNLETIAYSPPLPQRIKQFELRSILGHGGFGTVWRAKDLLLQRDVAVKVPRKDRVLGMNMALFLREARAAAKLQHPNIVAIHEVGEEESSAFIVSDLVDGVSLKVWLETKRPSMTECAMLAAKMATAAHHAHERGIIHRDLKPANVLIDRRGEPHITDFGLAKREAVEDSLAVDDQLVGTPAYMAPEQARGDHKAIDRRTDVYALGAILYEMLTGQRAFSGELSLMLNQIQHVPPVVPRKLRPEIPRELEAICLKCLAKDPNQRYPTAHDLANDLHRFIGGETLQGIPTAIPIRVQKWLRRHRRAVLASLVIALAASGLAGVSAWYLLPPSAPTELSTCHFTTNPPGCEITVVAIDPNTGEPDPEKIQDAKGVTPLRMDLADGEYLVVAVMPGEPRFHEVYRYVPHYLDTLPGRPPSNNWKLRDRSTEIDIREIEIPPFDVTADMGFVEGTDRLQLPEPRNRDTPVWWQIPGFFVDVREVLGPPDENQLTPSPPATRPSLRFRFGEHLAAKLEDQGKRLPSAAELYYLSNVICPAASDKDDNAPPQSPCVLSDRRQTQMEGLHSGRWEWTTTRPGAPFSGVTYIRTMGDLKNLRMVGGGDHANAGDTDLSSTGLKWRPEERAGPPDEAARGVRSKKPRRKQEDFMRPTSQQQ